MIANGSVEIDEQETGTYVMPVINGSRGRGWALYVFKDGSAQLYTDCAKSGALLGKPIKLSAPTETISSIQHTKL